MKKTIIPNTITLTNLFCGCLTLICLMSGRNIDWVPLLLGIALLADYTDGLVARMMRVSSELGKQLDSLSDMVSFGVVPGAMLFYMLNISNNVLHWNPNESYHWASVAGFLVTVFSCLRLAKFNLDDRQSDAFIGLSTPSSTILVLGLLLMVERDTFGLGGFILNPFFLYSLTLILSYLLIAEIPMFSFKFKHLRWQDNRVRFLFMIYCVACVIVLPLGAALAAVILSYIIISVILWIVGVVKYERRRAKQEIEE